MGVLEIPKIVSGGSCESCLSFFIVSEGFAIGGAAFVLFGGGILIHGHASVDEDDGEAGGADAGTAPVAFLVAGPGTTSADADLLDGGTYPSAFGGGL